jgi:predicted GTPase
LSDYTQSNTHELIDLVDDETDSIVTSSEIKTGTSCDPTFLSPTAPLGFAFLGKPNAGKSSLTNMLAQSAISRVDSQGGTTRDYISYHGTRGNHEWVLFDTA